jgi:hypothetical protein
MSKQKKPSELWCDNCFISLTEGSEILGRDELEVFCSDACKTEFEGDSDEAAAVMQQPKNIGPTPAPNKKYKDLLGL